MKFGDLAKYKVGTDLVISARHDSWMEKNSNPVYSHQALAHASRELAGKPRDRRGTISGSSLASCMRRQQFTFLGMPELPPTPRTAAIFHTGTFMHIRWQMAGLTEGWLISAEVPIPKNLYRLSGTMDGIAYDQSIVELKSINSNGFRSVNSFGPKEGHLKQGATYALTTGAEKVIFIYEDKDTQEYKEFVRYAEDLPLMDVLETSAKLWDMIDARVLAEPLQDCMAGVGYMYQGCPFRDRCMKVKGWDDAHPEDD